MVIKKIAYIFKSSSNFFLFSLCGIFITFVERTIKGIYENR